MIRIDTKAGHGAGKPTAKVVSVSQQPQPTKEKDSQLNLFSILSLNEMFVFIQIEEHADILCFMAQTQGHEVHDL